MPISIVDLRRYDEGPFENRLNESITLFDSLVNNPALKRISTILVLANYEVFKLKISRTPLGSYFLDYRSSRNRARAVEYIRYRFMKCNRAMLNIYPHVGKL